MSRRHRVLGAAVLAAAVVGCAAEDLEVVTGPSPNEVTVTTEAVVDDPADEQGSENGTTNNAVLPDDTSTTSSSSTTSSTTEPPPDTTEGTTSSTEPEGTTPPTNEPAPGQAGAYADADAAAQSVTFVNDRRAEQGEGGLRVDGELQALAEAWAYQMAADQEMRHNPNLSEQMPGGYYAWGENVAYGFDPAAINQAWWESDGHRANMLNGDYTAIGVGFVVDESGDYWAVQVFGGD